MIVSCFRLEVDVFSLGFVLWSLAASKPRPFARLSNEQAKLALLSGGRPPLPPEACTGLLREALCSTLRRCWHADPHERPSAAEVHAGLSAALKNNPLP